VHEHLRPDRDLVADPVVLEKALLIAAPAVPDIRGTIRAVVMLGEIKAMACAKTSQKFNALVFNRVWVFLTVTRAIQYSRPMPPSTA